MSGAALIAALPPPEAPPVSRAGRADLGHTLRPVTSQQRFLWPGSPAEIRGVAGSITLTFFGKKKHAAESRVQSRWPAGTASGCLPDRYVCRSEWRRSRSRRSRARGAFLGRYMLVVARARKQRKSLILPARLQVQIPGRICSRPYHARAEESRLKLVARACNHRELTLMVKV